MPVYIAGTLQKLAHWKFISWIIFDRLIGILLSSWSWGNKIIIRIVALFSLMFRNSVINRKIFERYLQVPHWDQELQCWLSPLARKKDSWHREIKYPSISMLRPNFGCRHSRFWDIRTGFPSIFPCRPFTDYWVYQDRVSRILLYKIKGYYPLQIKVIDGR